MLLHCCRSHEHEFVFVSFLFAKQNRFAGFFIIMTLFKYFKKVESIVSESAQASGLKEIEENEVQKERIIVESPPKKKKINTVIMISNSVQRLPNGA